MKAIWQGAVLAESDETRIVEGNHYFPPVCPDLKLGVTADLISTLYGHTFKYSFCIM